MTTAVSRSIPPQRLINLVNPVVRVVLQSPLHGAVDNALLLLHIVGRKTGHRYDIPVGYVDKINGRPLRRMLRPDLLDQAHSHDPAAPSGSSPISST